MARRNQVSIVEVRGQEVLIGDVINKRGHVSGGWFEVARVDPMPDGQILIADEGEKVAFLMAPLDIVWLQIVSPLVGNSHIAIQALPAGR